jgi:SAM-dependent methyltransferase
MNTIDDFGRQWQIHGHIDDDYWCNVDVLRDYVGPLLDLNDVEGTATAEVGSGSGRIIRMLNECKPASLHAIEPSVGVEVLRRNTLDIPNLEIHHRRGDDFDISGLDFIFSLGVIQFIQNPLPTLINIRNNLSNTGKFVIWVYGKENNGLYLAFFRSVHLITRRLNDRILDYVSAGLNYLLLPYIFLCRFLPLPMREYVREVFAKCGMQKRKYIIFDQLNPTFAKYYTRDELVDLLTAAGFHNIETHHRHGYSWTAVCSKNQDDLLIPGPQPSSPG